MCRVKADNVLYFICKFNGNKKDRRSISCKIYFACIPNIVQALSTWSIVVRYGYFLIKQSWFILNLLDWNNPRLIGTRLYSVIYSDQRNVKDKVPSFLHKTQEDKRLEVKAAAFLIASLDKAALVALIVYR